MDPVPDFEERLFDECRESLVFQLCDVQLIDSMGDDTRVVNSARISFDKQVSEMGPADVKLLKYLWTHEHTSPFRHAQMTFKIRAPIFVLRQWMKHVVGCSWNERSGRYVEFEDSFFGKVEWRRQSLNNKQGSEGVVQDPGLCDAIYEDACAYALTSYKMLRLHGVSKEQARIVLPLSMMSECYWTASLQAVMHFCELRMESHAQKEIRDPAKMIYDLAAKRFPHCMALMESVDDKS